MMKKSDSCKLFWHSHVCAKTPRFKPLSTLMLLAVLPHGTTLSLCGALQELLGPPSGSGERQLQNGASVSLILKRWEKLRFKFCNKFWATVQCCVLGAHTVLQSSWWPVSCRLITWITRGLKQLRSRTCPLLSLVHPDQGNSSGHTTQTRTSSVTAGLIQKKDLFILRDSLLLTKSKNEPGGNGTCF